MTDTDLKFREMLTDDEWQRYSEVRQSEASEVVKISFKKEMFMKGMKIMRDLAPKIGLSPEQIAEFDEAEKRCLARFDKKLKDLESHCD